MKSFIESFVLPAQEYNNLKSSDQSSAASQNLAMMTTTHANMSDETIANVMTSPVSFTKDKHRIAPSLHITSTRLPALMSVLEKHISGNMSNEAK